MSLQNSTVVTKGRRLELFNVTSQNGDKKAPCPHTYRIYDCYSGWKQTEFRASNGSWTTPVTHLDSPSWANIFPYQVEDARFNTRSIMNEFTWDSCRERALEKFYEKVRGNSEVLIDLAEAGQTIRMVRSATKLKSTMITFVKEMLKGKKRSTKEIASKWLEYRYGWLPLLGTIYDAGENLRRKVRVDPYTVRTRTTSSKERTVTQNSGSGETLVSMYVNAKLHARYQLSITFKPPSVQLQQLLNWTSLNPLTIAWELVPLSFVADWFVNVGDQLRAWENYVIYQNQFLHGFETYLADEHRVCHYTSGTRTASPSFYPSGDMIDGFYGSRTDLYGTVRWINLQRNVLTSLPRPDVGIRLKVNLNASRIADSAALTQRWWKRLF